MNPNSNHDDRIPRMVFASVYPHYLAKVEKKGRTKADLHQVITWLTGFDEEALQEHIAEKATFAEFFAQATLKSQCPPHYRGDLRLPGRGDRRSADATGPILGQVGR